MGSSASLKEPITMTNATKVKPVVKFTNRGRLFDVEKNRCGMKTDPLEGMAFHKVLKQAGHQCNRQQSLMSLCGFGHRRLKLKDVASHRRMPPPRLKPEYVDAKDRYRGGKLLELNLLIGRLDIPTQNVEVSIDFERLDRLVHGHDLRVR